MNRFELTAKIFKALMHPARLAILHILRESEHCVCHLEAHLGFRQAYISQQLAILRDVELVQDRRDGWNIYYKVIAPEVYNLIDTANKMTGEKIKINSNNPTPQVEQKACPCPKCNHPDKKPDSLATSVGQEKI